PLPAPAPAPTPPAPSRSRAPLPPPPRFDALPWWGPIGAPLPALIVPEPPVVARWRWGWGLRFGGASAIAPGVVPVIDGFGELAREGGLLAPAFRVGIASADSGYVSPAARFEARFRLLAGRAQGCPLRVELLPSLSARPCVSFEAGAIDASGSAA